MFSRSSQYDHQVPIGGSDSLGIVLGAGVLLSALGAFHILMGLMAVNGDDEAFVPTSYAFELSVPTWGWVHLGLGIVALGIGIGMLLGQTWTYVFALCLAFLSALGNFAFLPQAPIWSAMLIAFDVLLIRALLIELNDPR
jgi:hypothetical protein